MYPSQQRHMQTTNDEMLLKNYATARRSKASGLNLFEPSYNIYYDNKKVKTTHRIVRTTEITPPIASAAKTPPSSGSDKTTNSNSMAKQSTYRQDFKQPQINVCMSKAYLMLANQKMKSNAVSNLKY